MKVVGREGEVVSRWTQNAQVGIWKEEEPRYAKITEHPKITQMGLFFFSTLNVFGALNLRQLWDQSTGEELEGRAKLNTRWGSDDGVRRCESREALIEEGRTHQKCKGGKLGKRKSNQKNRVEDCYLKTKKKQTMMKKL